MALVLVVLRLACALTLAEVSALSVAVPIGVDPPKNCTVPVGLPFTRPDGPGIRKWYGPLAGGWLSATVAVSVPGTGGRTFAKAEESVVLVGALLICSTSPAEGAPAA